MKIRRKKNVNTIKGTETTDVICLVHKWITIMTIRGVIRTQNVTPYRDWDYQKSCHV